MKRKKHLISAIMFGLLAFGGIYLKFFYGGT